MAPDFTLDCDECGFVYDEAERGAAADAIRSDADGIAAVLRRLGPEAAGRRGDAATWSPLEYACHVRDVLLVQRERVLLARRTTTPPQPEPMGREERVVHDGYAEQRSEDVARQLEDAAALFANVLERLDDEGWAKAVVYNFPERAERSLAWVAVHTVHEVRHHRGDIERQVTVERGGPGDARGSSA